MRLSAPRRFLDLVTARGFARRSFTSFSYSNLQTPKSSSQPSVTVDVTNNGSRHGAEVAQLYLGFPPAAGEPPRQLKGFFKTPVLAPGAMTSVSFVLQERDLSIWDTASHGWAKQRGVFDVFVGASLCDIRATGSFTV